MTDVALPPIDGAEAGLGVELSSPRATLLSRSGMSSRSSVFSTAACHSHSARVRPGMGVAPVSRAGTAGRTESQLRRLRRENSALQNELSHLQQTPRDETVAQTEAESAAAAVVALRGTYNEARHQVVVKEAQLRRLNDVVIELDVWTADESAQGEQVLSWHAEAHALAERKMDFSSPARADCRAMRVADEAIEHIARSRSRGKTWREAGPIEARYSRLKSTLAQMEWDSATMRLQTHTLEAILRRNSDMCTGMEAAYADERATLSETNKGVADAHTQLREARDTEAAARHMAEGVAGALEVLEHRRTALARATERRSASEAAVRSFVSTREAERERIKLDVAGDLDEDEEKALRMRKHKTLSKAAVSGEVAAHTKVGRAWPLLLYFFNGGFVCLLIGLDAAHGYCALDSNSYVRNNTLFYSGSKKVSTHVEVLVV